MHIINYKLVFENEHHNLALCMSIIFSASTAKPRKLVNTIQFSGFFFVKNMLEINQNIVLSMLNDSAAQFLPTDTPKGRSN